MEMDPCPRNKKSPRLLASCTECQRRKQKALLYLSGCNTFGNNPDYLLSVAVNGPVTIVRPDGSPIVVTLRTKGRPELLLATVIVKSLCAYVL